MGAEPHIGAGERMRELREELAKKTWDQFTAHIRTTSQKERGLLALNVIEENLRRRLATLVGEFESVKAHHDETVTVAGVVPNGKRAEPEPWVLEILDLPYRIVMQDPDLMAVWKKAKGLTVDRYEPRRKAKITKMDWAIRAKLKEQMKQISLEIEFTRFRLDVMRNVIWRHIGFGQATFWDKLTGREKALLFGEGVAAKEDLINRAQVIVDVYYSAPDKYQSWADLEKGIAEAGHFDGSAVTSWRRSLSRHFKTNDLEWPTSGRGKANVRLAVEAIMAVFEVRPRNCLE